MDGLAMAKGPRDLEWDIVLRGLIQKIAGPIFRVRRGWALVVLV